MSINKQGLHRAQIGASLIEVLIALLVVSVGVMGLVATQMTALTNNRESFYRTQATVLASDIIDRARANRQAAKDGLYTIALTATVAQTNNCLASCTPAEIATNDIAQWKASMASQLPGGNGSISAVAGLTNAYSVNIRWQRDGEDFGLDFRMGL